MVLSETTGVGHYKHPGSSGQGVFGLINEMMQGGAGLGYHSGGQSPESRLHIKLVIVLGRRKGESEQNNTMTAMSIIVWKHRERLGLL